MIKNVIVFITECFRLSFITKNINFEETFYNKRFLLKKNYKTSHE